MVKCPYLEPTKLPGVILDSGMKPRWPRSTKRWGVTSMDGGHTILPGAGVAQGRADYGAKGRKIERPKAGPGAASAAQGSAEHKSAGSGFGRCAQRSGPGSTKC